MSTKVASYDADVITYQDGAGKRYLSDVQFDASHGVPFCWHIDEAVLFRREGLANDMLDKMRRAWPQGRFSTQRVKRREIR